MNGEFIIVNPYLVNDLKALNLWDFEMIGLLKYNDGSVKDIPSIPAHLKDKYKEVFQIDPSWLIKSAAHRGKWVDMSQSLNIYFAGTSGRELASIYEYAWSMGLKTTYYLRSLGASQVEKSTVNASEFGSTHKRDAGADTQVSSVVSEISSSIMSAPMVARSISGPIATILPAAQVMNAQANVQVSVPVTIMAKKNSVSSSASLEMTKEDQESLASFSKSSTKYKITALPEATCDGCQ
jgi:ribonucleoside-diphosphate reductase alpha chain